jgi:hypothetical protein
MNSGASAPPARPQRGALPERSMFPLLPTRPRSFGRPSHSAVSLRWRTFRPGGYAVDGVEEARAREVVEREHYSGTFPAARLSVCLSEPGPALVGAGTLCAASSVAARTTKCLLRRVGICH